MLSTIANNLKPVIKSTNSTELVPVQKAAEITQNNFRPEKVPLNAWTHAVTEAMPDSPNSQRMYRHGVSMFAAFVDACNFAGTPAGLDRATLNRWRNVLTTNGLSASSVNVKLAGVKRLAKWLEETGQLSFDIAGPIQQVDGVKIRGQKVGNWLTSDQVKQLLAVPSRTSIKGLRDRVLLMLLVGAGMRREEAVKLKMSDVQQREGRWTVPELVGKGKRARLLPIASQIKSAIDELRALAEKTYTHAAWGMSVKVPDYVLWPIRKNYNDCGEPSAQSMNAAAVYDIVSFYGEKIEVPELRPHDLRRTFARLAHKAKAPLDQIQSSLGHSSVQTTERYVGAQQNLAMAPTDMLDIWNTD